MAKEFIDQKEGKKKISETLKRKFEYGKRLEPVALERYKEYMHKSGYKVRTELCGLVVSSKSPWLGATPDSKVNDPGAFFQHGIVEIKCPEGKRDCCPAAATTDQKFSIEQISGTYRLRRDTEYYAQVQGQMALTGSEWCDFVVYTEKGMVIERILFDSQYWKALEQKLVWFYHYFYLPVLSKRDV